MWVCRAQHRDLPVPSIELADARPGLTHVALAELVASGRVRYLVSQNVDGLHRRSGVPAKRLSELHGNCFLETCWQCDAEFLRDFDVCRLRNKACGVCRARVPYFCHCTGRKCPSCRVPLKDTVIHFEEDLPEAALAKAFHHARKADLCIVLGSSLRVYPAAGVPEKTLSHRGKLVIVNKQRTPFDGKCAVRLFGDIDEVMGRLMNALRGDGGASGCGVRGVGSSGSGGASSVTVSSDDSDGVVVVPTPPAPSKPSKKAKARRTADDSDFDDSHEAVGVSGAAAGRSGKRRVVTDE